MTHEPPKEVNVPSTTPTDLVSDDGMSDEGLGRSPLYPMHPHYMPPHPHSSRQGIKPKELRKGGWGAE